MGVFCCACCACAAFAAGASLAEGGVVGVGPLLTAVPPVLAAAVGWAPVCE